MMREVASIQFNRKSHANKTRNASLPLGSGGSSSGGSGSRGSGSNSPIPKRRYFHYAIFVALLVSGFFNLQTLWGLFFIGLTIPAYRNRAVFFLDMIERDKEPKFYWAVLLVWISLGVLMVLQDWSTFGQFIPWTQGV